MKTITIAETKSGLIIVTGELGYTEKPHELFARSDSFNSVDKAIAHIRKAMKAWNNSNVPPVQ
jgi:hypothetical protein